MNYLQSEKIKELEIKADEIRKLMSGFLLEKNEDYSNASLEAINLFTLLYFHVLKHDPKNPEWKERDRIILSNNYISPALYATMAHAGYLTGEELKNLYEAELRSQDYYQRRKFLPGIEINSGSHGFGLSQAVGMTIADKIDRDYRKSSDKFFYCFLDNQELQEEQNWEAVKIAGKEKLNNLITVLHRNSLQKSNFLEDAILFRNFVDKFEALNWHVLNANSSNFDDMDNVIWQAQSVFAKPTVIVMQNNGGL